MWFYGLFGHQAFYFGIYDACMIAAWKSGDQKRLKIVANSGWSTWKTRSTPRNVGTFRGHEQEFWHGGPDMRQIFDLVET